MLDTSARFISFFLTRCRINMRQIPIASLILINYIKLNLFLFSFMFLLHLASQWSLMITIYKYKNYLYQQYKPDDVPLGRNL